MSWINDINKKLKEQRNNYAESVESGEASKRAKSYGGKNTMSGEYGDRIRSLGGKKSGPNSVKKMLKANEENKHYEKLHSQEVRDKIHKSNKENGGYKKFTDGGNAAKSEKHLNIYHFRVSKILPILPDGWFTRNEAEQAYLNSKVKEEINAPLGIIKRIITELEFVEDNGLTQKKRKYKKKGDQ